jgi:uncharacterized membrane protein YozB (DUF420 family)
MSILSTVNMILQIVILAVLLIGVQLVKDRSAKGTKRHWTLSAIAVVLIAVSLALVMVPSILAYFSGPPGSLDPFTTVSTLGHAFFGSLAFMIGVAFVLNKKPKNVRLWMKIQATFWFVAFLLGLLLYLIIAGIL